MKYIYEIGYGTYEESQYKQYYHDKKYSQKELEDIFSECMVAAIQYRVENRDENICQISYQDIMFGYSKQSFFEKELEKRGFDPIQPKIQASVSVMGWEHPLKPNWYKQTSTEGSYDRKLLDIIKSEVDLSKGVCARPYDMHIDSDNSCFNCDYVESEDCLIDAAKNHFPWVEKCYKERDGSSMDSFYATEYRELKKYLEKHNINVDELEKWRPYSERKED